MYISSDIYLYGFGSRKSPWLVISFSVLKFESFLLHIIWYLSAWICFLFSDFHYFSYMSSGICLHVFASHKSLWLVVSFFSDFNHFSYMSSGSCLHRFAPGFAFTVKVKIKVLTILLQMQIQHWKVVVKR